jgi:hypothetical protein
MRQGIFLSIAAALLTTSAAAQQWRAIPGAPGGSLAIDVGSIKREGAWRVFRTRAVASKTSVMLGLMAADCKAGVIEFRAQRAYKDGKLVKERTFPAAQRPRQKVANASRDPLLKLVCAG